MKFQVDIYMQIWLIKGKFLVYLENLRKILTSITCVPDLQVSTNMQIEFRKLYKFINCLLILTKLTLVLKLFSIAPIGHN